MGLAACPRASFAAGGFGAGVEGSFADLLRKCAWNGAGGGVGIGRIGPIVVIGLLCRPQNFKKIYFKINQEFEN